MRMWMVQTDDNGVENFRVEVDPNTFMPIGPKLRPGQAIPPKKGMKGGGFIVPPPGSERKQKKEKLSPSIDSTPKPPRNQEKKNPLMDVPRQRTSFPPSYDLVRNKGKITKKQRMA